VISIKELEEQLKHADCSFRLWGRGELRELCHILLDGEIINYAVNGYYTGGFALLCVTDQRMLLIDHKPMYLSIEDIRFDMISEIDYNYRLLNATVLIYTPNKSLTFTSWSQHNLRKLTNFAQKRVMEIRQYYMGQQTQGAALTTAKLPTFNLNKALQANTSTLRHAGRLSVSSAAAAISNSLPMHNPYAQVPLVSRHWASRRQIFKQPA
jgi:hypothetical protein